MSAATTSTTAPTAAPIWLAVCRVDDIPLLGARRVTRPAGLPVALFRTASG